MDFRQLRFKIDLLIELAKKHYEKGDSKEAIGWLKIAIFELVEASTKLELENGRLGSI